MEPEEQLEEPEEPAQKGVPLKHLLTVSESILSYECSEGVF